jgi:hypothetical protein
MIVAHEPTEQQAGAIDTKLMPSTFDPDYVEGAGRPVLLSGTFVGEHPLFPMIGLAFRKRAAMSAHVSGMLYDEWKPYPERRAPVRPGALLSLPDRMREIPIGGNTQTLAPAAAQRRL